MTNLPKISIITPSYNQGNFIEETILSIVNQNYDNLEYIIIDGGSTDNTIDIIKKYEPKIDYWVSEPDKGQSHAINKGLKIATGEIVAWLNSDDIYLPNAFEKIIPAFENPAVYLTFGRTIAFNEKKELAVWWKDYPDDKLCFIGGSPFPPQPSTFYRKKLFEEQGEIDERYHYSMDYDVFTKATLNYEISEVKESLSKFRLHGSSKSITQSEKFRLDRRMIFKKIVNSYGYNKQTDPILKELNVFNDTKEVYNVNNQLSEKEMVKVLLYFLNNQIHHYYYSLELTEVKTLINFIKTTDTDIYNSLKLNKLELRIKLLGKTGIKALRFLKGRFTL